MAVARAFAIGCIKNGDQIKMAQIRRGINENTPIEVKGADVDCCWGWGRGQLQRKLGHNVLIMERAYVGDRSVWFTLGWNGLYGRAIFPQVDDGGKRWQAHFADLMRPWRTNPEGYALLLGEVPLDEKDRAKSYKKSLLATAQALVRQGHPVRFRPHPHAPMAKPPAKVVAGTLQEAFEGAAFAVNWNSNAGVDAVLAGIPTVTLERGAMAWAVASHDLDAPIITPDRSPWAHTLAYTQWSLPEIESGLAWQHLRGLVN